MNQWLVLAIVTPVVIPSLFYMSGVDIWLRCPEVGFMWLSVIMFTGMFFTFLRQDKEDV